MHEQDRHVKVAKKRGRSRSDNDATDIPNLNTSNIVPIRGGLPVEVLNVDESYANTVHLKIIELMRKYEETYFELAKNLYEVKVNNLYRSLHGKYSTFQDYVEKAIGIDYRKAKYLTRLWWWYGIEQNGDRKLLEGAQEIGWSKAKELIEIVDKDNAERWFNLAKNMNLVDLSCAARVAKKAAIAVKNSSQSSEVTITISSTDSDIENGDSIHDDNFRSDGDDNGIESIDIDNDSDDQENPKMMKILDPKPPRSILDEKGEEVTRGIDIPENMEKEIIKNQQTRKEWKKMIFNVHMDNYKTIEDSISFAKKIGDSEHRGHLLSLICLHFNTFYDGKQEIMAGEWLAQIERLTGLSLFALDKRTSEIIYGSDLIDELAAIGEENASK